MKHIISTGSSAAIILSTLIASWGCSSPANSDSTTTAPAPAPLPAARDGASLFRGVFFGEGDAARQLPELWGDHAVQQRAALTKSPELMAQQLQSAIARMKAAGWSDDVIGRAQDALDVLQSGQPLPAMSVDVSTIRDLIVARLAESDPTFLERFGADMQSGDRLRVERALTEAQDRMRNVAETVGMSGSAGTESIVWYYGPVLVAVAAVAVAAVVVVVVAMPAPDETSGRLAHDELVNSLALRLKN